MISKMIKNCKLQLFRMGLGKITESFMNSSSQAQQSKSSEKTL